MGTIARYRLVVVLLTAALLATLTVALTGGDRAEAIDGPVDVVYVATGRNFPDALAGSTLAGALGAPLLTVEPNPPLPEATIEALTALDPDRIIVFGGPGAVSAEVFEALTAYARSGSVTRIAGDNRHDTAQAIADALPTKVHDSDLLDGLDATDFLRTTDASDFASSAPRVTHDFHDYVHLPIGTGGSPTIGADILTIAVTTPDECGGGATRHTYAMSYDGGVEGTLGPDSGDGDNAHAYTSLTLDKDGMSLEEGFRHVWVQGSAGHVEGYNVSVSMVFEDVAPGDHVFRVRGYTTSTSVFPLNWVDGTAIVEDVGFVCS